MKNRTKVLGGGGYNVVKNDSITLQNTQDNCEKLRESCCFFCKTTKKSSFEVCYNYVGFIIYLSIFYNCKKSRSKGG